MIKKRYLVAGIIVLLISGFFTFRSFGSTPKLEYVKVQKGDIKSIVSAAGSLEGKQTTTLRFKGSGKLAYLNVKSGELVYEGEVIAGLDTQELSINLQQAQNNLREKQAAVDKIIDDINLFQYGNGGLSNIGSGNETQTQRNLRTQAEVARDNAYDLVKAAKRDFQDLNLIAPISGIVVKADLVPGQVISPTDLIAQVVDTGQVFFDAEVDEADLGKISVSQGVEIILDAYEDKIFNGKVFEILPVAKSTAAGSTVIIARILLEDYFPNLIFGLKGQASINSKESKNTLIIPREALKDINVVYVQKGEGFESRKVETGIASDSDVEIKKGLNEGEMVVKNPPEELKPRQGNFRGILKTLRGR